MIKTLYWAATSCFLFAVSKYLREYSKPAEIVVKEVAVEKDHVRCIQCLHGTRDKGEPGKVYCMRMGCQMMPQAYCSMGELNRVQAARDKVKTAEALQEKAASIEDRIRELEMLYTESMLEEIRSRYNNTSNNVWRF